MAVEVKIKIKDTEGKTLTKPFLVYEDITMKPDNVIIDRCIKEMLEEFKGEVEDIIVKAQLVVK